MKVLVAHNRYRSDVPSGENQVVQAEIELLRSADVEVVSMLTDSDDIRGMRGLAKAEVALGPVYSRTGVRHFKELLQAHRPDLVHLHNVFPLISPAVISVARRQGLPVVHTVHNYRHSCVNGLHFRDGGPCTDCVGRRFPGPAVRHGCYRASRLQSVPMALSQAVHAETWRDIGRFLALTPFMARTLVREGVPEERIKIRPSWVHDPGPVQPLGEDVLFVGRLDEAKGVDLLLRAWASGPPAGRRLRMVGAGPLSSEVERAASGDSSIIYEGPLEPAQVRRAMDAAVAVVVPSMWFEGFPLVIAEAFAHGRPVLTTSGGSPASVVDESVGWVCAPQVRDLAHALTSITEAEAGSRGRAARTRYETAHSPSSARQSLLATYNELLGTG